MPTPATADRNLLFGLLSLKMDFITRAQLLDALSAWHDRKHDPLGLIQQRGALDEGQRQAIDALLDCHVARHGGAQQGLGAVRVDESVLQELKQLPDEGLRRSVASLVPPE